MAELGDRKPSQVLRHMMSLRGGTTIEADGDEIFREIFLQKLLTHISTVLAVHKTKSNAYLADMADHTTDICKVRNSPHKVLLSRERKTWKCEKFVLSSKGFGKKRFRNKGTTAKRAKQLPPRPICEHWCHAKFGSKRRNSASHVI